MIYQFKTNTTMKYYNRAKWWIDSDIIPVMKIKADNLKDALKEYQKRAINDYYICISDNALKHKNEMYIDTDDGTIQTGYVITGSTDFQTDDYKWIKQYIELWIEINILNSPF